MVLKIGEQILKVIEIAEWLKKVFEDIFEPEGVGFMGEVFVHDSHWEVFFEFVFCGQDHAELVPLKSLVVFLLYADAKEGQFIQEHLIRCESHLNLEYFQDQLVVILIIFELELVEQIWYSWWYGQTLIEVPDSLCGLHTHDQYF